MRPLFARLLVPILCAAALAPHLTAQSKPRVTLSAPVSGSAAGAGLASTTTQLTSSVASPTVGQATTLAATITPGPGSTTSGGIYVPGTPSGAVTFTDGDTTLGTAPLIAGALTFLTASPQIISAPSNTGFRIGANARRRTAPRPNETPSPDTSTAFSSLLADFNLDGLKDTLILDANSGNFHLLLGASPAGNFQPDHLIASGCAYLSGAAVADLNNDTFPDIAFLCLNSDNSASLFALYNLGDGTFGPATSLLGPTGARLLIGGSQIGAADLNNDGKTDLVVTGPLTAATNPTFGIQTFLGDGTGHFTPGPVTTTPADPGTQLIVKDLNNDGAPDLVLLNSSVQTYTTAVQTYRNTGTGAFTASAALPVCNCFTYTAKLFVTPLTANPLYPDLAVAAPDQQQTLVALNQRATALAFATPLTQSIPNLADAILGDLNGDGLPDLVFFNGTTISTLIGDGTGHFATQSSSPNFASTGYSAANVSLVAATDTNQDGYADLITIYPGTTFTSTINTYLTSGTAVASLPATFSTAATHTIASSYPGNVNLLGSNGALSLAVTQIVPVITWTTPATLNTTTPLNSSLLNATASVPGTFAYTPASGYLPSGTQTLSALFTPTDTNTYQSVTTTRIVTVLKVAPTTSALTATPNPQTYLSATPTVLTAALTGLNLTPTGSVQFFDGTNPLGPPSLTATTSPATAAATLTLATLAAGPHSFRAVYSGDAVYTPTTSALSYTVAAATPILAYAPVPSTIPAGTALVPSQFNATAKTATGAVVPGTFAYNHTPGDVLPAGTQTLIATFTPTDATSFQGGTVQALLTVIPTATPSATTLTITSGGEQVLTLTAGSVATLTATVSGGNNVGQVNFCDASATFCTDVHLLGSAQLTSAGSASVRFIPAIGTHTYRAIFLGTATTPASTSPTVPLTVTGTFPTATTFTASGSPASYSLVATVVGTGSPTLSPTGAVSFLDAANANNPIATAPLGTATLAQAFTTQPASGITGRILATADFNGDGIPDLLTQGSPNALVYLGNGNATFTLASTLTVAPSQAVIGDFNHDGIPDLALTTGNTISLLLGKGDGTFALQSTTPVPSGFGTLLAADFNHDGLLDLATSADTFLSATSTYTGILTVLLGDGTGSFRTTQTATSIPVSTLAVADFNADGIPDLVAGASPGEPGGTATIFLGKGDGTFTQKTSIPTVQSPYFTTADFNRDGIADIAVLNFYDGTVSVLLGNGDGTFTQKTTFSDPTAVADPNSFNIAVGDLNQDGIPDLAVTADDGISIYLGTGDGTFTMSTRAIPQTLATETQGHEDFGLALADFNGDGLLDLATNDTNLLIALNTITATASATANNVAFTTFGPHAITASYSGDTNFSASASTPTSLTGQPSTPILTYNPTPTTLTYGTPLPATLFNATVTTATGTPIIGAITYNHAAGDLLPAGQQLLIATFTPADPLTSTAVSLSRILTITRATPTLTWAAPAAIVQGTPLSATQLNAIATGVSGNPLPGTFLYTPPATTILPVGPQTISVTFTPTDTLDYTTATTTVPLTVGVPAARATLTSSVNPTQYGQPTTLTATVTPGGTLTAIPTGMVSFFDGTKPLGTATLSPTGIATLPVSTLTVGLHTLIATYLGDLTNATTISTALAQTVTKATPVITFPTPPTAIVGTPLSTVQLTPTVTGAAGINVPGSITFTPNTGIVASGPQTLSVTFTPTDTVNYNVATTTVILNGTTVTLTALSSSTAQLGDPAKTITLTGTGFVANSFARANGAALATTFVNATTLTAVLPASNFLAIQTLQLTVFNPTQSQTTAALPFTIIPAPLGTITFTGPATANSGDQPTIRFSLANPYPVDLTATVTLTFAPIAGAVDDPAIQFRGGGRTFSFNLTAGQTVSPTIQLQSGTVAGTIQVSLAIFITNGRVNVTPTSVTPIVITIPPAAPVITSMTLTRTGRTLTVNAFGLSNTRAITQASFHFTPATGQQIQTQDIPLDVTSLFSGWYTQPVSATYGSTFLYTQTFTLDEDATVVGQVTLTLSNAVGTSVSGSSN